MKNDQKEKGLSPGNRELIVVIFFFILLIWGPIEPYGIGIRLGYLVALPVIVWYLTGYLGKYWKAGEAKNDRFNRLIIGIIAGLLFVGSFQAYTADQHTECTQSIRSRDGVECVGDYITVGGPDKGTALFMGLLGIGAVWYAIADRKK